MTAPEGSSPNNGFGGHYFTLIFLVIALLFFSLFVLSHSKTRGSQLVS
jgi:hypothetical protein